MGRILLWLLALGAIGAAETTYWEGTWTATGGGTTLGGTWTARPHQDPTVGQGAWTLRDGSGRVVASGSWSARKGEKSWEGTWQARASSGPIYSGTWTARAPLDSASAFGAMLDRAVEQVVSGSWRDGRGRSGGWSIRCSAAK